MKRKVAMKDFNMSDLPSNRKEVFFDCIKNRYKYLLFSGFILFLTMIPFFVVIFLKTIYMGALVEDYVSGALTDEEYSAAALTYISIFDLSIIASTLIISIGICGLSRVVRQIGWIEPLFFLKDYGDGIKLNYKHIFGHMLALSIIYMLSDIALHTNIRFEFLKYIPIAIFMFIAIPIALYNVAQINIYDISDLKATKNSALFLLKSVPVCVLFTLIISSVIFIGFINDITIRLMIYILLVILLFPIYYLAWFLYSSYVFDKFININSYPEIVDKGIVRKENKVAKE